MAGRIQLPLWCEPGGIVALADLLDAHRGAFEYDWRARFRLPLTVVGTRDMSWGEALRLTRVLSLDGSSQVGAAVGGWEHPAGLEARVLMDLIDSHAHANFKKPNMYPRPWPAAKPQGVTRIGDAGGRTRLEVVRQLNALGHHLPEPDEPEGGDDG